MAVLEWCNTPAAGMQSSPVQRLMSKRTRTPLPMKSSLLQPHVTDVPEMLEKKRKEAKYHFDKRAKALPELQIGEQVRVQVTHGPRAGTWQAGSCVDRLSSRSYVVDVQEGTYRRNRQHIRLAHEDVHPDNRNDKKQHDRANSVTVQAQDMSRHVADPREGLQHQPQGDSDELSIHPRTTQYGVQQPLLLRDPVVVPSSSRLPTKRCRTITTLQRPRGLGLKPGRG